jgi:hypothetical protein
MKHTTPIICEICNKEVTLNNSVVCSEKCASIRSKIMEIRNKYFPTNGCDNCRGDLHQGCSEQCNREFEASLKFGTDLMFLTIKECI